jgi:3D (Asp-Asp-Asp) domain-containing protein
MMNLRKDVSKLILTALTCSLLVPAMLGSAETAAQPVAKASATQEISILAKPATVQAPVAKPVAPVAKSAAPAPVAKPVAPVTKPAAPAAKVAVPAAKPVTPVAKPVAKPVVKPVVLHKAVNHAPVNVTINKYGVIKTYTSTQGTVGEMLKHLGITYEGRPIYPDPQTPLKDGLIVHILGRYEKLETVTVDVPFETQYQDDKTMDFGKKEILKPGVPGKDKIVYEYILKDGMFQKQELTREHIALPEKALVKRGAAQSIMTANGPIGYKRKMTVEASAYTLAEGSGSGMTSLGIIPYEGIVAVDPNFIPYYTKMYIPGYGFAMAGDTGGGIRGYMVDLFMTSYYRAIQWGRRTIDIYIL